MIINDYWHYSVVGSLFCSDGNVCTHNRMRGHMPTTWYRIRFETHAEVSGLAVSPNNFNRKASRVEEQITFIVTSNQEVRDIIGRCLIKINYTDKNTAKKWNFFLKILFFSKFTTTNIAHINYYNTNLALNLTLIILSKLIYFCKNYSNFYVKFTILIL